ncbi:PAS domain-containing sensor histidine kinase [Sulfurimonas sp.]|uniref:PAS domain-containing sensor histidine kinase n=1 Tax=Sulfurimonas sp. TaxID=2022749 RepID=UPI0025FB6198|nr:PAS domain-containing sensor histidine kinase [Sulfurimonas sp.]MDD5156905.1 PAS domain-containing sensor histidine kinase [Sulfurimonas sp.]
MNQEILTHHDTLRRFFKQKIKENHPQFRYYKSIFNMTSNLVAVTDGDTIIDANKSFIDFFKSQNIDIFNPPFQLSNIFKKIDRYGYIYDGYLDQRWFNLVDNQTKDYYRVGIDKFDKLHEFNILIKHFEPAQNIFVVVLTDITKIMNYKYILEDDLKSTYKSKDEIQSFLKQYNNAIDVSNIVIKVDIDGNITYVNDEFCKTIKHTKSELINSNIKILCYADTDYLLYDSIIKIIKNGEVWKGVIKNIDKDGDIHFFNTTIIPIKDLSEQIVEYLLVQNEITELVKAKEEAINSLEIKNRFFDRISHELRTPLNAILNFTDQALESYDEIIKDNETRELVKMYIERAYKNSENLLTLINSLLDLSKINSNKEHFNFGTHDIVKLTKEAYENCSSLKNKKNIEYKFKVDFNSGLIRCDNLKFGQILTNLISNALKFTESGFVSINLSEISHGYLIEIKDSGIGIPADKLSCIFKPFEQARDSDIGTGLGLSIVEEYAKAMRITIDVLSSDGDGSCFSLKIDKIEKEDTK